MLPWTLLLYLVVFFLEAVVTRFRRCFGGTATTTRVSTLTPLEAVPPALPALPAVNRRTDSFRQARFCVGRVVKAKRLRPPRDSPRGKPMESEKFIEHAMNRKEQFATSPDVPDEFISAVMDAGFEDGDGDAPVVARALGDVARARSGPQLRWRKLPTCGEAILE